VKRPTTPTGGGSFILPPARQQHTTGTTTHTRTHTRARTHTTAHTRIDRVPINTQKPRQEGQQRRRRGQAWPRQVVEASF
jgi:hypothetical protein